jgi:arylsulfatase A-like enzyme
MAARTSDTSFSLLRERLRGSMSSSRGSLLFSLALFAYSHVWLLLVRAVRSTPQALGSFEVQQAILWGAFFLVDRSLRSSWSRLFWAVAGTLYVTVVTVDALLMRMTSLSLREILPMLLGSQDLLAALREIGFTPFRVVVLAVLLLAAAATGGFLRVVAGTLAPVPRAPRLRTSRGWVALALVSTFFWFEQARSRESEEYLSRALQIPTYLQLYDTSSRSIVLPIPRPLDHAERARILDRIGPARNPRHVLYVLLESFRADAVSPVATPRIWKLAQEGWCFEEALAEATYTPLSWSVLLFDEAAHDNIFGRNSGRTEPLGGWLFAVMRKAGYDPSLFVSTNLSYAKTRERLLGDERTSIELFQAATDDHFDPADPNGNDRAAVDRLVRFVEAHAWDERPQFLLLQLDSTHYDYPFPEDEAVFTPFLERSAVPSLVTTPEETKLLRHRYLNAARFVDSQLGRVLEAFERAGLERDLAIVLTSDHGEGLSPGLQGHGAVFEGTRRVPLILKLPGRAPARSRQLISHRDVLPTLAEYLGIDLPAGAARGRPASAGGARGVLTLGPNGRRGQFVTPEGVFDLALDFKTTSVVVTPLSPDGIAVGGDPQAWLPRLAEFLSRLDNK